MYAALPTKETISCEYELTISHCKVKLMAISQAYGRLARQTFCPQQSPQIKKPLNLNPRGEMRYNVEETHPCG